MTRLIAILALFALAYVALVHPERVVCTLIGFAAGVAVTSPLPWFVRRADGMAARAMNVEAASVHRVGTRIEQAEAAAFSERLEKLERHRQETLRAIERARVEIPPAASKQKTHN